MTVIAETIGRSEVEDFLYREAAYLDAWELDAWLGLYAADAHYCIPSTDKPEGDPRRDLVIVDDDRERLESRVERLKSRRAHREFPTSRTRHLVTNVVIERREAGRLFVSAAFMVWRFREPRADYYVGRYDYELIAGAGGLAIRSKRATLDMQNLGDAASVSIIL
jgi:p-cumate 2,3-dioxygenase beta subunit